MPSSARKKNNTTVLHPDHQEQIDTKGLLHGQHQLLDQIRKRGRDQRPAPCGPVDPCLGDTYLGRTDAAHSAGSATERTAAAIVALWPRSHSFPVRCCVPGSSASFFILPRSRSGRAPTLPSATFCLFF